MAQSIIPDKPELTPLIIESFPNDLKSLKKRLMVFEAKKWEGVREIGGANRGQIVEMFQKAVDGKAQGEPWCAAFCSFVIKTVDDTFSALGLNQEKTALSLSEHVMTLWAKSPDSAKTKTPEAGSLVVWQLYKDGKPTSNGHIGIVVSVLSDSEISTLEGNTNDGTGVERDGVGVFHRTRSIKGAGSMKVVGFIKPWC